MRNALARRNGNDLYRFRSASPGRRRSPTSAALRAEVDLDRLCKQSKVAVMTRVDTFPNGEVSLEKIRSISVGARHKGLGLIEVAITNTWRGASRSYKQRNDLVVTSRPVERLGSALKQANGGDASCARRNRLNRPRSSVPRTPIPASAWLLPESRSGVPPENKDLNAAFYFYVTRRRYA